ELNAPAPVIDAYRRNLQRAFLDIANAKLNAPAQAAPQGLPPGFAAMFITSGDERGFYRAELSDLDQAAASAIAKTTDRASKVHLLAVRDQIAKILDPKDTARTGGAAAAAFVQEMLEQYRDPTSCWFDY